MRMFYLFFLINDINFKTWIKQLTSAEHMFLLYGSYCSYSARTICFARCVSIWLNGLPEVFRCWLVKLMDVNEACVLLAKKKKAPSTNTVGHITEIFEHDLTNDEPGRELTTAWQSLVRWFILWTIHQWSNYWDWSLYSIIQCWYKRK